MSGPYALAARDYLDRGWSPIPVVGKDAPEPGFTGANGAVVTMDQVLQWSSPGFAQGRRNVGLRQIDTVGIDVDAYDGRKGAETFAAAVAKLGLLPPTWSSTARGAGQPSRILFYQVPPGVDPGEAQGRIKEYFGKNIDIIRRGHRYAIVAPSLHPEGWRYCWYDPNGVPSDVPPKRDELPFLPAAWLEFFTAPEPPRPPRAFGASASDDAVRARVEQLRDELAGTEDHANDEASRIASMVGGYVGAGQISHEEAYDILIEAFNGWTFHKGSLATQRNTVKNQLLWGERNAPRAWEASVPVPKGSIVGPEDGFEPLTPEEAQRASGTAVAAVAEQAPTLPDLAEVRTWPVWSESPDDDRRAEGRRLAALLAHVEPADRHAWVSFLSSDDAAGMTRTEIKDIIRAEEKRTAERRRAERAAEHARQLAVATEQGKVIPAPYEPMKVARELMSRQPKTDGAEHLAHWRGDWYRWAGTHWRVEDPSTVRRWLYAETENAVYDAGEELHAWSPDKARVDKTADALATAVVGRYAGADDERVIACTNGVLDPATGVLAPHTPRRFNLTSLPYAYDPAAQCPTWLAFLDSILPGDVEAHRLLAQWFGYVVSGRTNLHKIMSLVGPKRCGKGTIGRVLTALVGMENVISPKMIGLGGTFGMAGMVGKTLALMGDVRWKHRDSAAGVEVLLGISGEDSQEVHRKNKESWNGYLGVRFMLMSNDAPEFVDASGALADRMLHVEFTTSFLGREDPTLTGRLLGELPGVLNWALAGLADLNACGGHFTRPASAQSLAEEVLTGGSPAASFLADRCELDGSVETACSALYREYRLWAQAAGHEHLMKDQQFGRALISAGNGRIRRGRRTMVNGKRDVLYVGVYVPLPTPTGL